MKTFHKKPKWSFKTNFWAGILIAVLVSAIVLIILKKSIWIELEIILGILSFFIFIFFYYVFYHGVRFDKSEKYSITWTKIDFESCANASPVIETGGELALIGAESGISGFIIGLLLDIVLSLGLSFVIAVLLWLGLNIGITAILVLFLPLFYIFKRSLRYVIARSKRCHKDMIKSFFSALLATFISTSWLYVILLGGHYLSKML